MSLSHFLASLWHNPSSSSAHLTSPIYKTKDTAPKHPLFFFFLPTPASRLHVSGDMGHTGGKLHFRKWGQKKKSWHTGCLTAHCPSLTPTRTHTARARWDLFVDLISISSLRVRVSVRGKRACVYLGEGCALWPSFSWIRENTVGLIERQGLERTDIHRSEKRRGREGFWSC